MIYIPLWFYSNIISIHIRNTVRNIYIPLWFYSNLNHKRQKSSCAVFTFHYGSILIQSLPMPHLLQLIYIPLWFYSNSITSCCRCTLPVIYIPLWFYSNCVVQIHTTSIICIYIPLWFYSNIYIFFPVKRVNKFTFHYGSILI